MHRAHTVDRCEHMVIHLNGRLALRLQVAFLRDFEAVLPLHEALIMLAIARERGVDEQHLLQGTEITSGMLANDQARISYIQLGRLIDNAIRLTGDSALGIECGRRMHIGHLGILGTALLSQPDLRSALDMCVKYSSMLLPGWQLTREENADYAVIQAQPTIQIQRIAFATEVLLGCLRNVCSFLLGEPMHFVKHECAFPAPSYVDRYRELTTAPISFSAQTNAAWFSARLLDRKLAFADALTARAAERYCASHVAQQPLRGPLEHARQLLRAAGAHAPSLTELARALGVSPRQLRRELHAEGASYRGLLDEVRKQRAIDLLLSSSLTVDEVARELGFQDARHFRRRFKHWVGDTPMAFRTAHHARA